MQTSGDLVDLDLGQPAGREAGFLHRAIVIMAPRILDADPSKHCDTRPPPGP